MGVERVQVAGRGVSWPLATWAAVAAPTLAIWGILLAVEFLSTAGAAVLLILVGAGLGAGWWFGGPRTTSVSVGLSVGALTTAAAFGLRAVFT